MRVPAIERQSSDLAINRSHDDLILRGDASLWENGVRTWPTHASLTRGRRANDRDHGIGAGGGVGAGVGTGTETVITLFNRAMYDEYKTMPNVQQW